MKQKIFPGNFFSKKSIKEFKILPNADVGILEEFEYISICLGETLKIIIGSYYKKFPRKGMDQ